MLRINAALLVFTASLGMAACAGESGGAAVPAAEAPRVGEELAPASQVEASEVTEPAGASESAAAGRPLPQSGPGTVAQAEPSAAGGVVAPSTSPPAGGAPAPQTSGEGPAAPAQGAPDAEAILRRAEAAYEGIRTFQADFVQDLSVPLLNSTQRSRGEIFVRKPDRFLMRFNDPAGDLVVTDGTYLWMYYPSTDARQVVRTSAAQGGQQLDLQREFLSNPTARYRVALNGTETVGGRAAHVLTLTPRSASPYERVRIWVDTQDHLVRRFEIVETNETVRRLELSNLRPNATVSEQLFRFTPPAGAQIFDQ